MKDTPDTLLLDGAGGTAMHRDRDARQEPRHRIPASQHVVEYDEELLIPRVLLVKVDLERLKSAGWLPLSLEQGQARVAAVLPGTPELEQEVLRTLGAESVEFLAISAADLARTIANNQDVNPGFPASANRTTLAKVRNYLADRRSLLSSRRTVFAKGRTGLAMFRTGLTFITTLLLLVRIFGLGWAAPIEAALMAAGLFLAADGLRWYLPARRLSRHTLDRALPPTVQGIAVLEVQLERFRARFSRTAPVPGAVEMREDWASLSPVMRRRFLALERTELAEERTLLAYYRTRMAMSRTGLALGRTGVALAGIGVALVRQFHTGGWDLAGWGLVSLGVLMTLEGIFWSFPGRAVGLQSVRDAERAAEARNAWDLVLPPGLDDAEGHRRRVRPTFPAPGRPGIWGSTGLALERTLLAARRNAMARLRTHMARARTGLACVRTGTNFIAVGTGLLVSFGLRNPVWTTLELVVLALGLALAGDGLAWYLPAERVRRRLPYCMTELDIALPDYTRPASEWPAGAFSDHA